MGDYSEQLDAIRAANRECEEARKLMARLTKLLRDLDGAMFRDLCPKSHYKTECEPAFCTYQVADTCQYLKMRREINGILAEDGISLP